MKLEFGYCAPFFAGAGDAHPRTPLLEGVDAGHLERAVVEAEELGYDSLWAADHLMLGRDWSVMEGWTFLSWACGLTTRIRLGTIHLANLFRAPALTAKMAATLDVISGGRLEFFFDAGHRGSVGEAGAYGFPFPDDAARLAAFEEALEIVKAMWTEERPSFEGRYHRIEEAVCYPKPVQKPHPPVWIGTAGGEEMSEGVTANEAMVDVIARHADGWNNTPASVEFCRRMLRSLEDACRRNGREFAGVRKSLETQVLVAETAGEVERLKESIERLNPGRVHYWDWEDAAERYLIGDAETVAARVREYADLGIDSFMLWFMDYPSLEGMRVFARRVMPGFREV